MAQTVTDEELEAKRDKNAKLREQILSEEAKAAERLREQENVIEAAELDAETARLEAQLARAREASKVKTIRGGTESNLASAREQMRAAEAMAAATKSGEGTPGAPQDPTPEEQASNENKE